MSEQRNADKDREIIAAAIANPYEFIAKYGEIILHWMDRAETCEAEVYKWREKALQQEQRVAELEKAMELIVRTKDLTEGHRFAIEFAEEALKGGTE